MTSNVQGKNFESLVSNLLMLMLAKCLCSLVPLGEHGRLFLSHIEPCLFIAIVQEGKSIVSYWMSCSHAAKTRSPANKSITRYQ
jgi:hypothetical protein